MPLHLQTPTESPPSQFPASSYSKFMCVDMLDMHIQSPKVNFDVILHLTTSCLYPCHSDSQRKLDISDRGSTLPTLVVVSKRCKEEQLGTRLKK